MWKLPEWRKVWWPQMKKYEAHRLWLFIYFISENVNVIRVMFFYMPRLILFYFISFCFTIPLRRLFSLDPPFLFIRFFKHNIPTFCESFIAWNFPGWIYKCSELLFFAVVVVFLPMFLIFFVLFIPSSFILFYYSE